ncbi:MAG TPA: site-specific DNA-methyltransferase [Syntrophomonadaceae bacterium]|nr:site-specific DNA-methyltransferase [Syntrophomonadaceae bacterium]
MTNNGARLTWDKTDQQEEPPRHWHVAERIYPCPVYDGSGLFTPENKRQSEQPPLFNRLVQANNLHFLKRLIEEGYAGKIDLIYIDPPYLSQGRYASRVEVGEKADRHFIARQVFDDSWGNSMSAYLEHMFCRLQLMHELLSPGGSIFVHLDWHVSHYVKLLLDAVFAPDLFINEIVWCYGGGSGARRHFHRKHDAILWYAKSQDYIFNPQYRPYSPGTRQRGLTRVKGDKYQLHQEGAIMQDWWTDINKILSPTAYENLKFPTQKPLALLQRIIASASLPGSLVADFYSGSGTLAQVCEQMERRWIACDDSSIAIHTTMQRMIKGEGHPFTLERTDEIADGGLAALPGIAVNVYDHKHELRNVALSLEKCRILSPQTAKDEVPALSLAFWAVDLEGLDIFSSDLQVMRSTSNYQSPLPLEMTLSVPTGVQAAVKAYDLWGREYYSRIQL